MDILVDIKKMLYFQDISRWLKLDKLGHQSQMLGEWQRDRENKACEFLLEDTRFNTWYNTPESRQLVILGAKGHGKTFTMTFLAEELERRNRYQLPRPVLCQYYCRDDETGKATNVLCALIYSLLNHKQLEGLQKPFHERYREALGSDLDPASNIFTLEKFLGSMLRTIDRPIVFVIDGIDECDDSSQNSLLNFLNSILQTASGLKIILSARPRQEILDRLDDAIRIELAPDPKRDFFIVEKTIKKLPRRLSPDAKAQIQKSLSERMQGSGIWTKMIVELINARRLMTKDAIDQFLEALPLPQELSKVYNSLLSRCTSDDDENWQLADTALRGLAFSHRPLSILELAWAVEMSLAQNVRTVHALAKMVDHQRVMELIHPFIASPDYDEPRKPQVRLTHQSVKEWVRQMEIVVN
ncbi:Vegetative incompatibility protein HET-E-1 [Penicillium subrubescens]|uniref:Vegetative incompatibility protein HET-E-1 n=1 Tax=Penicillium subrubescens TaxID=1316194 RepID=A0A1Q5T9P8_9EURO|nr:Vegetative incompatibility protein HET-E-1 [Penicillium subrubescens]